VAECHSINSLVPRWHYSNTHGDLWASLLTKLWFHPARMLCGLQDRKPRPIHTSLYPFLSPSLTNIHIPSSFTHTSTYMLGHRPPDIHPTTNHHTTSPHPLIPLKNPLLPNSRHKLNRPLLHPPLPARARQHSLITCATFILQQHQFVDILAVSRARLPFPLIFAKVHAGEVCSGVCCVARS
jgi:hypothetical protein